jgi:peptidyl-prolyl cis-trans isomerase SurA
MIETNDLVTPREAMEQVRDIHQQLVDGGDFDALARENSDDISSSNLGGDMGWFQPQAYGERMGLTLEAMQDGDISEPFQTEVGWHIIERLGKREKDVTDEAMRNAARNNLQQQKMDIEVEQFLQQLRDEAFVEIRLDS